MKATLIMAGRLLAVVAVYAICFTVVSGALLRPPADQPAPEPGAALSALLAVSFLNSVVVAYIILRSRWAGWKLIVTIFFVLYGVTTVMSQIESAFFLTRLPPGMVPRLFLAGAIVAALVSPLAVLILGKRKPEAAVDESRARLPMTTRQWGVGLAVIAVAYVVIYFTFGYYIAWKSAAVRAYYGGIDPGSLFAQLRTVVQDTPWLVPLQVVRAILWTAIAVPVIRMMKGEWWEAGLAVALLFSVVMNSQLLLPNVFMPREVRMAHLVETASSNVLFGWLVVMVLRRSQRPARS